MPSSVVEYFSYSEGSCGYCKGQNCSRSSSMWAHVLTAQDYQDLIDRGWRRSGQYCYKPNLKTTCCPLYTIRCDAINFKPSKSQKKLLKRVSKYFHEGESANFSHERSDDDHHNNDRELEMDATSEKVKLDPVMLAAATLPTKSTAEKPHPDVNNKLKTNQVLPNESLHQVNSQESSLESDSKPICKKAKLIRLERRKQKHGEDSVQKDRQLKNPEKKLEDFLSYQQPKYQLELRLVPSNFSNKEFEETFEESFAVYKKYQTVVHNDVPSQCSKNQFKRFLVTSAIKSEFVENLPSGFGSFHHQYRLNGKLIAVGVVDILPKSLSSVYFYYDPDYSFLSLGTYSSLREIALIRSINKKFPQLKYYYMGFYIHTCPKMSYKARLAPSYLLCPESYVWRPIEEAKKLLDINKYSRLGKDDDQDSDLVSTINNVMILFDNYGMPYAIYKEKTNSNDDSEVKEYAELVGKKCSERMFLFRE